MEYTSNYTNKKVRPAQKIVELICQRIFAKDGITLPPKFWNDKRFARTYKLQLIMANALLKKYSAQAIIAALQSSKGKRIWSLSAKFLDPIIEVEQKKLDRLESSRDEYQNKIKENVESEQIGVKEEINIEKPQAKSKSLFEKLDF